MKKKHNPVLDRDIAGGHLRLHSAASAAWLQDQNTSNDDCERISFAVHDRRSQHLN